MRPGDRDLRTITLGAFRNGAADPTTRWENSTFWRATWTPQGPAAVAITLLPDDRIDVDGFGPGAPWLVDRAPFMIGLNDDQPPVTAHHDAVHRAQRSWATLRLGRTDTPYHELIPAVLGQRITARDAAIQWRALVQRFGCHAPGPHPGLFLPPDPEVLATVAYHELHELGIERRRAETIRRVARSATSLISEIRPDSPSESTASLMRILGVGQWTAAVAGSVAFGDTDALQVGDFHVKNTVAWALRGEIRGTDDEMIRDMAVYAGQRHRVVLWLTLDGWRAPRRGPGRRNLSIARL